jgi:hypothetical protein
MATSGTVGQTVFETQKVIDHAFRRCKIPPQAITPEWIETAFDLLFLNLSALASYGIPMWTIEKVILPIYRGERSVPLPVGTVDVFNMNIRDLQRTLGDSNSSSEGDADNAFDSDLDTATTQTTPGGFIQTNFGSGNAVQVDNYGIFFNSTATLDISIQGSQDGITFTDLFTDTALEAIAGDWIWIDLEQQVPFQFIRLQANGTTVLDIGEFFLGNTSNEIPMPKISRDTYSDLPDKTFLGRPTEYWYDKQAAAQGGINILTVWPLPNGEHTFFQYVLYVKRQIQDVGTMLEEIEVPQRWYKAVITDLAKELVREIPEADISRLPILDADARKELKDAWTGEDDGAPVRLAPRISVYTR